MHDANDTDKTTQGLQHAGTTPARQRAVLTLAGALLIGLLALAYLNQVAGVNQANSELRALNAEQTRLQRQDAELHQQLGTVTSPVYIDRRARELGLAPAPAADVPPVTVVLGGQP